MAHGSRTLENCTNRKGNKRIFNLWDVFKGQNAAYSQGSTGRKTDKAENQNAGLGVSAWS